MRSLVGLLASAVLLGLMSVAPAAAADLVQVSGATGLAYGRGAADAGSGWLVSATVEGNAIEIVQTGPDGRSTRQTRSVGPDWAVLRVEVADGIVGVQARHLNPCEGCGKQDESFLDGGLLLAGRAGGPLEVIARDQVTVRREREWVLSAGRLITIPEGEYRDVLNPPLAQQLQSWTPTGGLRTVLTSPAGFAGLTADAQGALAVQGPGSADARLLELPPSGEPRELPGLPGLVRATGSPNGAYVKREVRLDPRATPEVDVVTRTGDAVLEPRPLAGPSLVDDDAGLWSTSTGALLRETPAGVTDLGRQNGRLLALWPGGGVLTRTDRLMRVDASGVAAAVSWVSRGPLIGTPVAPDALIVGESGQRDPGCTSLVHLQPDPAQIPARPTDGPCPAQDVQVRVGFSSFTTTKTPLAPDTRLRVGVLCVSGDRVDGGCSGTVTVTTTRGRRLLRTSLSRSDTRVQLTRARRAALREDRRRVLVEVRDPAGQLLSRQRTLLR